MYEELVLAVLVLTFTNSIVEQEHRLRKIDKQKQNNRIEV